MDAPIPGLELVPNPGGRAIALVAVESERWRVDSKTSVPSSASLLAGGFVVSEARTTARLLGRSEAAGLEVGSPWCAGLGHLVGSKGQKGIQARALAKPEIAWRAVLPRSPARVSFVGGGRVAVLTEGGLGARGSLHLFELATGRALRTISLDRVGLRAGIDFANVIAGDDGVIYLGLGGSVAAISAEGQELWRWPRRGEPVALAGESASALVVCDPRSFTPVALDVRTGQPLWESRDACLNGFPKVDSRGLIYWRREQELVALDPLTGTLQQSALVGESFWEFALAGNGRAYALRAGVQGKLPELVIVE